MDDTYDFWKKAKEEGRYEEEKQALADQISRALIRKFPQIEGNIDVIDIATPLTYERYTGAYRGSPMTIMGVGDKMKYYPGCVKNISGLYFAGQRLLPPGGLPVAVDTGRKAAQMVCRQFDVMCK
jgi:phytoene dehydrogenase-like protein